MCPFWVGFCGFRNRIPRLIAIRSTAAGPGPAAEAEAATVVPPLSMAKLKKAERERKAKAVMEHVHDGTLALH